MIVNNHLNTAGRTPGFGNRSTARKVFEFVGNQCNIEPNGSLSRIMFFLIGGVFMLGSRFLGSRNKDEKREVLTRDIPGVALAAFGAPMLNSAIAHKITQKTGIPIITFDGKRPVLVSQKQITDWYSGFSKLDNPLINFAEMLERNGGNISKVMKKLGFENTLNAISNSSDNKTVLAALKEAQTNGSDLFKNLENIIKHIADENQLLKSAKNSHAGVKLGGILLTAALLGFFIPRFNILVTRKKYKDKPDKAGHSNYARNELPRVKQPETPGAGSHAMNVNNKSTPQAFKSFNQYFV
jgi:hypothetical protein